MKKILSYLLILCGTTTLASATTRCVEQHDKTYWSECEAIDDSYKAVYTLRPDWKLTCPNTTITGIAVCGATTAATNGTSNTISISDDADNDNLYCWCKMGYPFVSDWVMRAKYGSFTKCVQNCPWNCALGFRGTPTFRTNMGFPDLD